MRKPFLEALNSQVLLFDGAMGTEIYARGQFINVCYDGLNLSNPSLIREVHEEYVRAGADVIETNTFAANRVKLKKYGLEDSVIAINEAGARLAREAAGEDIYVAGSMGPGELLLQPEKKEALAALEATVLEQARALVNGGIDLFLLETFSDVNQLVETVRILKRHFDLPIIAQMTIGEDGSGVLGTEPGDFARRLESVGADVVGLNCTVGPKGMLEALEQMTPVTRCPISIMPNAGLPQNIDGRNIYLASAEYFGEYARHFINAGARIIGGCCGTTPEFTKAMRKAVVSLQPRKIRIETLPTETEAGVELMPSREKSPFAAALADGRFVTTVEIVPPRGSNPEKALEQSRILKEAGVNAVNIPDGPRALSRMGAQYLSLLIHQQTGMDVIQHTACRDRNLLGMVGDLLGADAMGIRNLLIITGDPPKMGSFPDATAVFDVDSIGLTSVASTFNRGFDLGGNTLPAPTRFFLGVGVNPGAIDLDHELKRFREKIEAGAEYAITQPVFDLQIFNRFLDRIEGISIPVIAGIWPLVSLRNAEFMNNEVPGASVPDEIIERMRRAASRDEAREIGLNIAAETVEAVRSRVAGVQVSMPFGNVSFPLHVLKNIL